MPLRYICSKYKRNFISERSKTKKIFLASVYVVQEETEDKKSMENA
jgi:hypothetical protein